MRLRLLLLASASVALAACTDVSRSPVGEDLLPGGVLQGDLQVVVLDDWPFSVDYEVFPSGRAEADRLVGAVDWPAAPGFESRPIIRFSLAELDSIPDGAEILSLNLKLVYSPLPSEPVSFTVHRLTSGWSEQAATWTRRDFGLDWEQPGGDFDPEPLLEFTLEAADVASDSAGAIDSIAVAFPQQLVDEWADGTVDNHGIVLIAKTPGVGIDFASRGQRGTNLNAPRLEFEVQLGDPGSPVGVVSLESDEDTFLAVDRAGGMAGPLLDVGSGDPVRRVILTPSIEQLPPGATVAEAKLVVSVDEAIVPGDSLRFVAREVFGEFRGEKTVLSPITSTTILGIAVIQRDSLPVDSLVFESTRLRTLVRRWISDPETISPLAITVLDEEFSFGRASLFTPQAAAGLRPRLRLLVLPPADEVAQ